MTKVVEAAGLVLFTRSQTAQFLLMKHPNRWDLPKGHAEPGESLLQTALRETEEETGICADDIEVDQSFQYVTEYFVQGNKRGDYQKRVTYFVGTVPDACDVRLTEHIGFRWWDWPVTESIQPQSIDPLIAEIAKYFGRGGPGST